MKLVWILKTARFVAAGIFIMLAVSSMVNPVIADEVLNSSSNSKEVIIKGTVIQADDVCGVIVEDNIYIIPCDQVGGFNEKRVAVVGMVSQEGDVQSIYATQVKRAE